MATLQVLALGQWHSQYSLPHLPRQAVCPCSEWEHSPYGRFIILRSGVWTPIEWRMENCLEGENLQDIDAAQEGHHKTRTRPLSTLRIELQG